MTKLRDDWLNIVNSVIYYLNTKSYTKDGSANNIISKYSLNTDIAFPEDFKKIIPPLLIIEAVSFNSSEHKTYSAVSRDYALVFSFFGGGKTIQGGHAKQRQMLQVMNDLGQLLDLPDPGEKIITMYDYSSGVENNRTNIGSIEFLGMDATMIDGSSANLDVEKYRFTVTLNIRIVTTIY